MDHSLVYLNETMRHAMVGHPGWIGRGGEFWQNVVYWRREVENPFSILALKTPWTTWKTKKIGHWKVDCPGWLMPYMLLKITKKEEMEPKEKQYLIVDMTMDKSKVWCCRERYFIGTQNVRFMNESKQKMTSVNTRLSGISELKFTGMDKFSVRWPFKSESVYINAQWKRQALR